VPRPFIAKALNTKEEINPDRYGTRPLTGMSLCSARVLDLNTKAVFRGGLLKENTKEIRE